MHCPFTGKELFTEVESKWSHFIWYSCNTAATECCPSWTPSQYRPGTLITPWRCTLIPTRIPPGDCHHFVFPQAMFKHHHLPILRTPAHIKLYLYFSVFSNFLDHLYICCVRPVHCQNSFPVAMTLNGKLSLCWTEIVFMSLSFLEHSFMGTHLERCINYFSLAFDPSVSTNAVWCQCLFSKWHHYRQHSASSVSCSWVLL